MRRKLIITMMADSTRLQGKAYDFAMQNSKEKGPCCCSCIIIVGHESIN